MLNSRSLQSRKEEKPAGLPQSCRSLLQTLPRRVLASKGWQAGKTALQADLRPASAAEPAGPGQPAPAALGARNAGRRRRQPPQH